MEEEEEVGGAGGVGGAERARAARGHVPKTRSRDPPLARARPAPRAQPMRGAERPGPAPPQHPNRALEPRARPRCASFGGCHSTVEPAVIRCLGLGPPPPVNCHPGGRAGGRAERSAAASRCPAFPRFGRRAGGRAGTVARAAPRRQVRCSRACLRRPADQRQPGGVTSEASAPPPGPLSFARPKSRGRKGEAWVVRAGRSTEMIAESGSCLQRDRDERKGAGYFR